MRLIDADALERHEADTYGAIEDVVLAEDIENAPTIDPEDLRHKGEWEWTEDGEADFEQYWVCSCCGEKDYIEENYCPNCGAKMEDAK